MRWQFSINNKCCPFWQSSQLSTYKTHHVTISHSFSSLVCHSPQIYKNLLKTQFSNILLLSIGNPWACFSGTHLVKHINTDRRLKLRIGLNLMAQLADPPSLSAGISHGHQFISLLHHFPSSSLLLAWKAVMGPKSWDPLPM